MSSISEVNDLLGELNETFSDGLAMGLHVEAFKPKIVFQTYSQDWRDHYSRQGLAPKDATIRFGLENDNATARWSEFPADYDLSVLEESAKYGLKYGFTVVVTDGGTKSVGSASSATAEFSDEDIALFEEAFKKLHALTADGVLPAADEEKLVQLALKMTHA